MQLKRKIFTLSTLSSGLNSLAAIFLEDFLKPFANRWEYNISETKLTQLSKFTGNEEFAQDGCNTLVKTSHFKGHLDYIHTQTGFDKNIPNEKLLEQTRPGILLR